MSKSEAAAKKAPKGKAAETDETEAKAPRGVVLTVNGKEVKRVDYIRGLWEGRKHTRGAIAKKLTELQGKPVPYQIVFAATKGIEGGPEKEEAEED